MKPKPQMIGAQKRNVTAPGGFVTARKNVGRSRAIDTQLVRDAANRALEKRGILAHPNEFTLPVVPRAGT